MDIDREFLFRLYVQPHFYIRKYEFYWSQLTVQESLSNALIRPYAEVVRYPQSLDGW
jgi:hypothetical protein